MALTHFVNMLQNSWLRVIQDRCMASDALDLRMLAILSSGCKRTHPGPYSTDQICRREGAWLPCGAWAYAPLAHKDLGPSLQANSSRGCRLDPAVSGSTVEEAVAEATSVADFS